MPISIIIHEGTVNEKHNETPFRTHYYGYNKRVRNIIASVGNTLANLEPKRNKTYFHTKHSCAHECFSSTFYNNQRVKSPEVLK